MSDKKANFIKNSEHLESMVNVKDTEEENVKVINSKKYTLVGEDKIPTRVEPSRTSTSY